MRSVRLVATAAVLAGMVFYGSAPAGAQASATVQPETAAPGGSVAFFVTCPASADSATLFGTTLGLTERIPMSAGDDAGNFDIEVTLPSDIQAGRYSPSIDCSNGSATTASFSVSTTPVGGVDTGGAPTAGGTDETLMAAGVGAFGAAVIGAGIALRLRKETVR